MAMAEALQRLQLFDTLQTRAFIALVLEVSTYRASAAPPEGSADSADAPD